VHRSVRADIEDSCTSEEVSWRDTSLFHGLHKEKRMVEILRGDFMKFCGPLDPTEVQEGCSISIEEV
jgi:hypothetical protein